MNPKVQEILQAAEKAYYQNPDMVKFLLAENLAVKSLLLNKGLLDPEEFKQYKEEANQILEGKSRKQIAEQLAAIIRSTDAEPSS